MIGARPITQVRHRELEARLNSLEMKAFMSINGAIRWLQIIAIPFCALFACTSQKCARKSTVDDLCRQAVRLCELKIFRTTLLHARPNCGVVSHLSLLCSETPGVALNLVSSATLADHSLALYVRPLFFRRYVVLSPSRTACQIYSRCGDTCCRRGY